MQFSDNYSNKDEAAPVYKKPYVLESDDIEDK